jgi:predicted lipoprotein with Yx(FWY)xxD motif
VKTAIISTIAFVLMTGASLAAAPTVVSTDKGDVLAGENGMTLYTFTADTAGMSNCYDKCADNWPPMLIEAGDAPAAPYSAVERKDGTKQWAKDGMPLYYWVKDAMQGDTTGDGVGGKWNLARP